MTNLKPLLHVLKTKTPAPDHPPWWLMRQAGRYLPEYRDLRRDAGGFLDLVYNPERASEVTLQPLRRFNMSAAILFSDILVIPQALGQEVRFETGEGPRLGEFNFSKLNYSAFERVLSPIYETVGNVRQKMTAEGFDRSALIGFCGAPWTVACYMIEGRGSKDFQNVREVAYGSPDKFQELIDLLVEASTTYLLGQIRAGVEVVQIFDSWAGLLDEAAFREFVIQPTKQIIKTLRAEAPDIPIIGFPRGAGALYHPYVIETAVDGVGIDPSVPTKWAARVLSPHCTVQGNLDPVRLLSGGDGMVMAVEKIMNDFKEAPFIFNLGHGVIKETPPDHVHNLSNLITA